MKLLTIMSKMRIVLTKRNFRLQRANNQKIVFVFIVEKINNDDFICFRCQKNHDSFNNCIVVFNFFDDFCANCYHDDKKNECNLRTDQ